MTARLALVLNVLWLAFNAAIATFGLAHHSYGLAVASGLAGCCSVLAIVALVHSGSLR